MLLLAVISAGIASFSSTAVVTPARAAIPPRGICTGPQTSMLQMRSQSAVQYSVGQIPAFRIENTAWKAPEATRTDVVL